MKNKSEKEKEKKTEFDQKTSALKGSVIDPLLECLVFLSAHFGKAKSHEAIKAGLAYDENGMGPQLFCEAAEKLSLNSKIIKRDDIRKISQAVLPVVLVLNKQQACVLLSFKEDFTVAEVFLPETGARKDVKIEDLENSYSGFSIYVHPSAEFLDRSSPEVSEAKHHWFWGSFLENISLYRKVLFSAVLINIFALTSPLFVMNVYDRVIPNNAIETGWVLGIGALIVFIFDFIIRTLRGYFIDLAGRRIDVVVSRRIFDQVMNMKLAFRPSSSGVFANMLREFDAVRDFMTSATLTAVVDLPFSILFLLVIYMLGGPIAFILASLIVIVMVIGLILQIPLRSQVAKSVHSAEAKHGLLVEGIQGLETIKAIGADGRMRARYGAHVGESAEHGQRSRFISGLGVNAATTFQQCATILVILLGMYLVRDANISMGALIACVILGGRAIAPIGQVANLMARYHHSKNALKTLDDIMKAPVERPSTVQFLNRPTLEGKLTFKDVSFSYPGTERKVLDNISFTINPGEKVGIVGRIGSGKSTLARLIMGLYQPDEGAIYADDTDYNQIDPADLRRNMAYIAQDVVLFRGSVKENISISLPQISEEELLEAAKSSGVHDFVSRHPMGYDAEVGERGDALSGGQKQAIALARAMLLKPNVMVCDEPTNSMDIQAEEAFTKHIREHISDKTLLLITHRLHLLSLVERVILLDQGKIIIDDSRDKVIDALSKGQIEVPKR